MPPNKIRRHCFVLIPYGFFRLVHNGLVVLVGKHRGSVPDVHPLDLGDLVLLRNKVVIFGFCNKIHHYFLRVLAGKILNGLAESGINNDVHAGLLKDFSFGSLGFRLSVLNVSLGERPVSAVDVFDEQYLNVAVMFTVDYCAAGFFMGHMYFLSEAVQGLSLYAFRRLRHEIAIFFRDNGSD